ncbi:MAG TPA: heat shock protein HspQ [Myxococcota bacterium]|nr:heat shock protein HspQ [Myxococcota bacterium]
MEDEHGRQSPAATARFAPGQLVRHRRFDYRGVVADVDAEFSLDDAWYARNAVTRPPRDRPWYHVLVDGSGAVTYVAERNLDPDPSARPVEHPLVERYFEAFRDGSYVSSLPRG